MLTGSKGLFCISTLFHSFVLSVYCYKIRKCKLRFCIFHRGFSGMQAVVFRTFLVRTVTENHTQIPNVTCDFPSDCQKPLSVRELFGFLALKRMKY